MIAAKLKLAVGIPLATGASAALWDCPGRRRETKCRRGPACRCGRPDQDPGPGQAADLGSQALCRRARLSTERAGPSPEHA